MPPLSPTQVAALRKRLSNRRPGQEIKRLRLLNDFISKYAAEIDGTIKICHGSRELVKRLVAIKDNLATEQYPTTCASRILQQYQSPFEATAVKSLRRNRGSVVLGKTNMDEFGMGSHSINSYFGPVCHEGPLRWHSVGGSSGGSAVAVATGQCDAALGTDTGGSVRLPAAYTGVVGFKPSYGLISRWGVVPYANSLDTVGILGTSTTAVASLMASETLHDPRDPTSLSQQSRIRMKERRKSFALQCGQLMHPWNKDFHIRGSFRQLKIGVPLEYNITEMDPVVRDAWQNALELLQKQGCTLVPISLPNTKHALSAYYVLAAAEAASNLSKYDGVRYGNRADSSDGEGGVLYSRTRGEGFGEEVKRRILLGSYTLSSKAIDNYFIKAQKVRRLVQRDFDRVFSLPNPLRDGEQFDLSDMDESVEMNDKLGPPQVDFIVCPTAPTLPPLQRWVSEQSPVDSYMNDVFTVPSSLAGLPAISLPFKIPRGNRSPNSQSFTGIQLIGQYSDDYRLLVTAKTIELLHEGTTRFLNTRKDVVRRHRPPFSKRHWATKVPITKFVSPPKVISKYLSGRASRKASILKMLSKRDTNPGVRISKHPSRKGDYPSREPRSEKEITRAVEDAFEEWESMISGRR